MRLPAFAPPRTWEKQFRGHLYLVISAYLSICAVGVFRPGPQRKDMVILEWARAHAELGLGVTKGYNLSSKWSTAPTQVYLGAHNVYVSAPPLQGLMSAAIYSLCGQRWWAVRLTPAVLGLVYLWSCAVLAAKYLTGPARIWLLYFVLSPMLLIYSTVPEVNAGNLGVLVLAYLCVTRYLESGAPRWMSWAGILYLLGFWINYLAMAVVPPIVLQVALHRSLPWRQRRRALLVWVGFVLAGVGGAVAHLALLPGALSWLVGRAVYRFSGSTGGVADAHISLVDFAARQAMRLATYYTPICVALAGVGVLMALRGRKRPSGVAVGDGPHSVRPGAVLLQFLLWGFPFGALAVNYAYIHAVSLYYFSIFMAFGSALGLDWITGGVGRVRDRRILGSGLVAVFLVLSIGRSLFAMSGGSLPALVRGRLPAWVTRGVGAGDEAHGDSVIPRDQW